MSPRPTPDFEGLLARPTQDVDATLDAGPERLDDIIHVCREMGLDPLLDAFEG